jgi:hypothetical protein
MVHSADIASQPGSTLNEHHTIAVDPTREFGYILVVIMAKRSAESGSARTFAGRAGKRRLLEAIRWQTLISGNTELARATISAGILEEYQPGKALMRQGEPENDIFLVVTGEVSVRINGRPSSRSGNRSLNSLALDFSLLSNRNIRRHSRNFSPNAAVFVLRRADEEAAT